ncbi:MAG: hypothetical protein V2J07_08910 [Anaerolineae bacterium]|jgi:hypothetical protein|nr:hypothetical protein [Anaerolineae bacterium]
MAAGSINTETSRTNIAAFFRTLQTTRWTTGIETAITALISLLALVFFGLPLLLWIIPGIFVVLTYASIFQAILALGVLIRVLFAGVEKMRWKYLLFSLVPLILSYFLTILSILLVNGYAIHITTYIEILVKYQSISSGGVDRFIAIVLVTLLNMNSIWMIFCQFTAILLGWLLWLGNFSNILSIIKQAHQYDSMVTFRKQWLWLLGSVTLIAMVLSLISIF